MSDPVQSVMLVLHIANLAVSAYLFKLLLDSHLSKQRSFSKTTKIMFVAVLTFIVVELVQVFRFFSADESQFVQALFTLVFLLLLLCVVKEMRTSALAHDHLMKRRQRTKMSDVD
jgi:uncharacterized membrane protein